MSLSKASNLMQDGAPGRPDAYFLSPELAQRADLLIHLTENSHLTPLIRGGEGMGKTTFIQHLLEVAPENWIPVQVSADVMLQPDALLAHLARHFDLEDRSDRLMDDLATRFDDLRHDGHLPVIIVDDAHLLPETSIITLLRLHERGSNNLPLAQLLLFAEPEIDDLLKAPQLRAMNLQSLQLLDMPEFTLEQTERYLQHLLFSDNSGTLADSQIQRIYEETDGSPGLIKQQAKLLIESNQERLAASPTARKRLSGRTIIGGSLAAIVVLLVLIYQDAINAIFSSEDEVVSAPHKKKEWTDDSSSLLVPDYAYKEIPLPEPAPVLEEPAIQDAPADIEADEKDGANSTPLSENLGKDADAMAAETPAKSDQSGKDHDSLEVNSDGAGQTAASTPSEKTEKAVVKSPDVVSENHVMDTSGGKEDKVSEEKKKAITARNEEQPNKENAVPGKTVSAASPAKVEAQEKPQKKEPRKTSTQQIKKTVVKADKPTNPKVQNVAPKADAAVEIPEVGPKVAAATLADDRQNSYEQERRIIPAPVEELSIKLAQEEEVPKPEATGQAVEKPAAIPTKADQKEAAVVISAPVKPVEQKVRKATNGFFREDWLLQQAPASYTIQIAGMQDEKGVAGYVRRNSVQGRIAYYHTLRNGKDWFPVLYGAYPTRENAEKALGLLPENIRKSGAWIRTLGSVQKDIKAK